MNPVVPYLVRPGRVGALAELARSWRAVVLDCETTGTRPYLDRFLGFSIGNLDGDEAYYLPNGHVDGSNIDAREIAQLKEVLAPKPLLGYNVKFDLHVLFEHWGESPLAAIYDIIVASRLLATEQHAKLALEIVAGREIWFQYKSPAAGKQHLFHTGKYSVADIALKCNEDVHATRELYKHFKPRLTGALLNLFKREMALTPLLFAMERRGVKFEAERVGDLAQRLEGLYKGIEEHLRRELGLPDFNPRSTKQVGEVLANLSLKTVKTEKGNDRWGREQLLLSRNNIARSIAQCRALRHNHSNFVSDLQEIIDAGQDTIHGSYNQYGTVTGRLSSSGPNLQNFPKGWLQLNVDAEDFREVLKWDEEGAERDISLRALFRPRPDYVLVRADYRQLEMFVAGYYLQDPSFMELLNSADFHAATALKVWGSERYRDRAKWYNFGLLYGLGITGLAARVGCSKAQAGQYQEEYFAAIPTYPRELSRLRNRLSRDGYVTNVYGRQYWLPPDMAYVAFNYRCQGSAGDFVKFRSLPLAAPCRELGIYPLLETHDEYVFEVPERRLKDVWQLVPILEDAKVFGMQLPVALKVGYENLADLVELKKEAVAA